MEKIEARVRRNVRIVAMALSLLAGLALGCQLDITINKKAFAPNPLLMGIGLIPGVLAGLLVLVFIKPRLIRPTLRMVSPFWIGMVAAAVATIRFNGQVTYEVSCEKGRKATLQPDMCDVRW